MAFHQHPRTCLLHMLLCGAILFHYFSEDLSSFVQNIATLDNDFTHSNTTNTSSSEEEVNATRIQNNNDGLLMEYMAHRGERFDSWFESHGTKHAKVRKDADADGAILDFSIVGFPKCGTTTMEANLGNIAPMPISDVCTQIQQTIWYAYKLWPRQYPDAQGRNDTKLFRGTKCPASVYDLPAFSNHLPRTKVILGIRHPVLWFQSFWNMQAANHPTEYQRTSPYDRAEPCVTNCNQWGCGNNQLFCVARARFHVTLAKLGKTPLNTTERALLAPDDRDGGIRIRKQQVRNTIFLYEQTELNEEDVWETLARLLKYPGRTIPHGTNVTSHGRQRSNDTIVNKIDICDAQYDGLRKIIMPYGYEMSQWICEYFVESPDVVVTNHARFCSIVGDYGTDPCGRLVRLADGRYKLKEGPSKERVL